MIELQKRYENNFRNLEMKFSDIHDKECFLNFYKLFIETYKQLDKKFSFTEFIDEDYIFSQAEEKYGLVNSPLCCIPFGIKDIFNTRILPTSMGSDIWKGFKAGNNARVVDEISEQGGIVFSKTTTAEFAVHFITPASTLNPYNVEHITGTSSSGSAVAVACGALPVALGTQTAGSIIRPASFCGVYGFKPSFGAIDRTGVLKTNDTLDTIGLISADIYGLKKVFYNIFLKGRDYPFSLNYFKFYERYKLKKQKDLKVGFLSENVNVCKSFKQYVKDDFNEVVDILSKNFNMIEVNGIDFVNEIHHLHEQMYSKSLSYYFTTEMQNYDSISNVMRDMISRGEKISTSSYLNAIQKQPLMRKKFDSVFESYDFIITPSTASYAPKLMEGEIDDTCLIWTFLGYPTITIPLFMNKEKNLPYGLQIVAKKFDDFSLLQFAEKIEEYFK